MKKRTNLPAPKGCLRHRQAGKIQAKQDRPSLREGTQSSTGPPEVFPLSQTLDCVLPGTARWADIGVFVFSAPLMLNNNHPVGSNNAFGVC
ncbi:MAG: hypothetical protein JKY18_01105 [Flavobacteriales bacterium]|nr:hypothetical protein [Flavobacteriales bacterium]